MARPAAPEVWEFIKRNKFLGMIIPKEYRRPRPRLMRIPEVVRKISVAVGDGGGDGDGPQPRSGPGELLMHSGTKEQRNKMAAGSC